jgi:predicted MPP superfamily phosphohydrolase
MITEGDLSKLEQRLGRLHAQQRFSIEADHEAKSFGRGRNFFSNLCSSHFVIRNTLKLIGLYRRGAKNAERVTIRKNEVLSRRLPSTFDGFTILHISDLHVDISTGAMKRLAELLPGLSYDICVLTGDFRGATFGPFAAALAGLALLCARLKGPIFGVLGNHDTIRMVPELEGMGVRMLLNECEALARDEKSIHLAGVDDASFYRAANIEKAAAEIPPGAFSILLSHTPEVYRQAAHVGFDLLLSGHTHGGQICLPGSIPIILRSARRLGSGPWTYAGMAGYTSVGVGSSLVAVRFNCLPEITLHRLRLQR